MDEEKPLTTLDIKHTFWRRGDLIWKLDSLQEYIAKTVLTLDSKKICILSSRQIGKSWLGVIFAIMYLIRNPNKIARIIAPTLTACSDIVNDNLSKIIEDAPGGFILRKRSDMRWEFENGSSLRLGALERAHVDGNRGGNASLILYEECGFVKGDDFSYGVDSVIAPQLLRSNGIEIFISSPSEDPDHPLHTRIKAECETLGTFFAYTVYDSPSITPEMIEEAKRRSGGEHTDAFQREYLARIIRPSSYMVIPDYEERRHVLEYEAPAICKWTLTVDWGGVRDLTVALVHGYDFFGAKHIVWDEKVFKPNTPTNLIVDALKQWEIGLGFYIQARFADVPGQTLIDIRVVNGYDVSLPNKSDWLANVNALSVLFSTDGIVIHPRCKFLRRTLAAALFNKNRSDFDRSKELGHCDAIASLMYGVKNQNTSSPYLTSSSLPENIFMLEKPKSQDEKLAESLSPKTWSAQRTFGTFRRD